MNIFGNNAGQLDEVIFENRNKRYGAYAIRSAYTASVIKSLGFLTGIVALLFGSVLVKNHLTSIQQNNLPVIIDDHLIKPLVYETPVDLTPPSIKPEKIVETAAPKGSLGVIIKDNAIETHTTSLEQTSVGAGTETATGTSSTSSETSTITTMEGNLHPTPKPVETVIIAEEMPEFEGGVAGLMRYVSQNIIYPAVAREIGKEGTVYVSFIVNETGNVENAKVMRGIGSGCDEEVLRVVSNMPRWKKVGKNSGHPVKVRFNIPVSFKLK
ncbi:MAG: hypothetical protein K0R26_351 [Bacteroidota bacterium]|jgi:protein TonB|nr:hypothetical protein [Bacteroidota bacterium]